MSSNRSITGVTESPSKDRQVQETPRATGVSARGEQHKKTADDELPAIAVRELAGVADSLGRKVEVEYDAENDLVIFSVYDSEGKELIRRIPPESAVRIAQRMRENKSFHLSQVL